MPTTTSPLTTPRSGFVQPAFRSVIVFRCYCISFWTADDYIKNESVSYKKSRFGDTASPNANLSSGKSGSTIATLAGGEGRSVFCFTIQHRYNSTLSVVQVATPLPKKS